MDADQLVRPSRSDGGLARGLASKGEILRPLSLEDVPISEAVLETLPRSVAFSTNQTYTTAWSDWRTFCSVRNESPVMVGGAHGRVPKG